MKTNLLLITLLIGFIQFSECKNKQKEVNILFLHHSTGGIIFNGNKTTHTVPKWFEAYNNENGTSYSITEQAFPKKKPYGWKNYPSDYYNIWVKNAGDQSFMEEPTLEMLTKQYDVIIFKHCFPVSSIEEDDGNVDINSSKRTLANYKLQYNALNEKLNEFPDTKFIVFTGAALVENATTPGEGKRSREFFEWVKNEWDTPKDNIFIWDFFELETEGGIYLKTEYAASETNSHPTADFAVKVLPLFCDRVVDVIEKNGKKTNLKGEIK